MSDRHIRREVNWDEYDRIKALGRDEIALQKGHRDFVVIVTVRQAEGRIRVLAVLPDRKKETVKGFLGGVAARLKSRIASVCTEMYDRFINAVKEETPQATVVADRFPVAKKYLECADGAYDQ